MREFDAETLNMITAFENITGTEVRDCLIGETVYFVVNPGKAAMAIGRGGQNIKAAERMLRKQIRVYEWAEEIKQFVKNLVPCAQRIDILGEKVTILINQKERGAIIGRGGNNVKVLRELLERNSEIKDLKVI
jgi:N utilization substance protein A